MLKALWYLVGRCRVQLASLIEWLDTFNGSNARARARGVNWSALAITHLSSDYSCLGTDLTYDNSFGALTTLITKRNYATALGLLCKDVRCVEGSVAMDSLTRLVEGSNEKCSSFPSKNAAWILRQCRGNVSRNICGRVIKADTTRNRSVTIGSPPSSRRTFSLPFLLRFRLLFEQSLSNLFRKRRTDVNWNYTVFRLFARHRSQLEIHFTRESSPSIVS